MSTPDGPDARPAPPAAADDAVIRLEDVHKSFGTKSVLRGLDLAVRRGETFVILGPSGTGKSVTLKLIVGLLQPDRGHVWVEGRRVDGARSRDLYSIRANVGYLFQSGALINWLSVADNVALPVVEHSRRTRAEVDAIVDRCLEQVHMLPSRRQMPAELSGGQRRRVALARVLAASPRIILYDEPTAGLDPVMTAAIAELIRGVQREFGVTSILVTHDLPCAWEAGDRIAMVAEGKVVFQADAESFRNTDHPVVRNFLSGGRRNGGPPK